MKHAKFARYVRDHFGRFILRMCSNCLLVGESIVYAIKMRNIVRLIFICRIRQVAFWSFVYNILFVWVVMRPVGDSFRDIRCTPDIGCRPADGQRWSSLPAVE